VAPRGKSTEIDWQPKEKISQISAIAWAAVKKLTIIFFLQYTIWFVKVAACCQVSAML
jgi:hypothetical protein